LDSDFTMATQARTDPASRFLDKEMLRQSVAALQVRLGLSHDPAATGEQAQAMSLASGVKPDDRVLSGEILRMRREENK
jgi:hypothetical protein